jgi:hypothetical protein
VPIQPGLPPRWDAIADTVRAKTGRELLLRLPPEAFSDGPLGVEVLLDGQLLGQFEFWWNDENPDEALEELRQALSVYLDEELRTEDW